MTDLFRTRLGDAELPVRDGFWEELNQGLATCQHRKLLLFRLAAAASVVFVMAASAAFWFFPQQEEIEEAFTQVAVATGGALNSERVGTLSQPVQIAPILPSSAFSQPVAQMPDTHSDGDSVTTSISFRFTMSTTVHRSEERSNRSDTHLWQMGGAGNSAVAVASQEEEAYATLPQQISQAQKWALKMALGSSLPTGSGLHQMPFTGVLTVERRLNNYLSLETGLQYSNLASPERRLHYIGVPLKMSVKFVQTNSVNLYALAGGVMERCVAGASARQLKSDPIQLSLVGGVGVDYQLSKRVALFAEPSVSHHFRTDSSLKTIRTERPTNLNLICGVRMIY